jgi:hypothetical protein
LKGNNIRKWKLDHPLNMRGGTQLQELADRLAKKAACKIDVDIACCKIPKGAVTSELKRSSCTV